MKIAYSLTANDYQLMHELTTWRSPKFKKRLLYSRITLPLWFILLAAGFYFENDNTGGFIFAGLAVLLFLFYPAYVKYKFRNYMRGTVQETYPFVIDQPIELELNEDFVEESQVGIKIKASYDSIVEILETQDHILIRLKTAVCFLIPRLCVTDWEPFADRLKELAITFRFKYEEVKSPWRESES